MQTYTLSHQAGLHALQQGIAGEGGDGGLYITFLNITNVNYV